MKKALKWSFLSISFITITFISVLFLNAMTSLTADEPTIGAKVSEEDMYNEKVSNDYKQEEIIQKDTENNIVADEFGSFENYVSAITKDFNGETELSDIYTPENMKYHLVVTSTNYLKYYKEKDEIPDNVQSLVDEGINVTNDFENSDHPETYYDDLKRIHNQLNEKIESNN